MKNKLPPVPLRFAWVWVLLIVIGIVVAKPFFRIVKKWRAEVFFKRAEKALNEGDFNRAHQQSLVSAQLHPNQTAVYRILARLNDLQGNTTSLRLWALVVQDPQATDDDRRSFSKTALKFDIGSVVEQQLGILLSRPIPDRETYYLAGLLALGNQHPPLAREWFRKALEVDPQYTEAEFNLAKIELWMFDKKQIQEQGMERLRYLSLRQDLWGLEALRLMVQFGKQHPSFLTFDATLVDRLGKHSMSKIKDKCLTASWELHWYPSRKKEIIDTLTLSVASLPLNQQRDLAVWFNQNGWYEKTLSTFPLTQNTPNELILVELDALAAMGRWHELSEFLAHDVLTDQPVLRSLFRARAARELNDQKLFDVGWRQAMREADKNIGALLYLAEYTEKLGETTRSIEAYEAISELESTSIEVLLKLIRLYEIAGKTNEVFRTIKRISLLKANDSAVINDLGYLGLLLNDFSVRPVEKANEVYQLNPRLPAFATTYALAQLKQGSPAVALKVLESFSASELTAPGGRAVYAAALAANGYKKEGVKVAEKIDYKMLKKEEKQLLAGFWTPNSIEKN